MRGLLLGLAVAIALCAPRASKASPEAESSPKESHIERKPHRAKSAKKRATEDPKAQRNLVKKQPRAKRQRKRKAALRKRKAALRKKKRKTALRKRKKKAAQRKRKALRKRRGSTNKRARGKSANRPKGWQWPPSKAMIAQGERCKESLTTLGVAWVPAKRAKGIATPIRVPSLVLSDISLAPVWRKPPFPMDCHLALALTKASSALKAIGVAELRFSSIYSYRRAKVNGIKKKALSRHSYGLAVDIYQVRDAQDRVFIVKDDYFEEEFLRDIEKTINESQQFRLVLSPQNDPKSHHDHFHLEVRIP